MTTLYLIRHAHATWSPDEQRPLSTQGQQAAHIVATRLHDLPITAIYSSSAQRAYQTVLPLAQKLRMPIHQRDELRERMLSEQPVDDFLTAVRGCWEQPDFSLPGGESNKVAQYRGVSAVQHIIDLHPDQHIVIATHGNLLSLILQHYEPAITFSFWQQLSMPDVYEMELHSHGSATIRRLWHDI